MKKKRKNKAKLVHASEIRILCVILLKFIGFLSGFLVFFNSQVSIVRLSFPSSFAVKEKSYLKVLKCERPEGERERLLSYFCKYWVVLTSKERII